MKYYFLTITSLSFLSLYVHAQTIFPVCEGKIKNTLTGNVKITSVDTYSYSRDCNSDGECTLWNLDHKLQTYNGGPQLSPSLILSGTLYNYSFVRSEKGVSYNHNSQAVLRSLQFNPDGSLTSDPNFIEHTYIVGGTSLVNTSQEEIDGKIGRDCFLLQTIDPLRENNFGHQIKKMYLGLW